MSNEPYVSRSAGLYASKSIQGDYKKLIVCCDGTWQAADKGFRSMPSNAVKLSRALSRHQIVDGREIQQIVYYQSGVATGEVGKFARKVYGNLGMGLDQNILGAYYFLTNNYDPGDKILLFGFSRGAYTVRIVADLVAKFGLIGKDEIDRFPVLYEAYRDRISDEDFDATYRAELELYNTHRTKVEVLGVWDTVGSMGFPHDWPWWITAPFGWLLGLKDFGKPFRDSNLSNNVEHAFQAMGLDEHRTAFSPALWHLPPKKAGEEQPNLIQCWFPGVHINTGGGSALNRAFMMSSQDAAKKWLDPNNTKPFNSFVTYVDETDTDLENLADISFAWMIDLCRPFLSFDEYYLTQRERSMNAILEMAPNPVKEAGIRKYASGPIADTYSKMFGWLLGGSSYRRPGQYDTRNHYDQNLIAKDTNEFIHPSVRIRSKLLNGKWTPESLKNFNWEPNGLASAKEHTSEWVYQKELLPSHEIVSIKEWGFSSYNGQSSESRWLGEDLAKDFGIQPKDIDQQTS